MKNFFLNKNNLFILIIGAFVLWKQAPLYFNNTQKEGLQTSPQSYSVITVEGVEKDILFPPTQQKVIALFWATWCGPCKIEMKRLQASVKAGKIAQGQIFAINPFEARTEITAFLKNNNYSFTFIEAQQLAKDLNITVTPTTLFFDKGKVVSMSSGLSITGIWGAETFLQ